RYENSLAHGKKPLYLLDGLLLAAYLAVRPRRPYMKLSTGKIVLGATLALSVGAFTCSASASIPTAQSRASITKNVGIQLAQVTVGQKVDEKADEVKAEATGAKNAVVSAHRRHERNERLHHTV